MNNWKPDNTKKYGVTAVGSWTIFDHPMTVKEIPAPGDTVEILSDVHLLEKRYFGGCAPNNTVASARLGVKTALLSVVGDDFIESGYKGYLIEEGVDIKGTIVLKGEKSGHSFLFSLENGETICLSHIGPSRKQQEFDINLNILEQSNVIILNYLFDSWSLQSARIAKKTGAFVMSNGNIATSEKYAAEIVDCLDLLICTEYELDILLKTLGVKNRDTFLHNYGVQALVITHGGEGATLVTASDRPLSIKASVVPRMVDPVGAGDGFAGGIGTGISLGYSLVTSIKIGSVVGSFVIEKTGCQTNLPNFEEMKQRYIKNYGDIS